MSVIANRSVLRLRWLAAVACVLLSSTVVLAQSDGTKDAFQPRQPPGGKAGPREKVIRLQRELARLREEAPAVQTRHPHTKEIEKLAREVAESGRPFRDTERAWTVTIPRRHFPRTPDSPAAATELH